ncbi:hypothetical protein [Polyangium jinanense]|uniref:Lipoprotein n=1 Tax=Polyangium jinanense TaxID=2829994 RepID=A0A9X4AQG0_9BACT|nr:hypothetical protein [Polyangium jinanense]MDC3953906.1 hypothetical protein [Polyangium jinanense]MDC3957881.1 hypothetical protein [Polyangium jinanense]MDC3978967.1 hypothetical protein [Polyangium jinanense]MDC3982138.1 hypothetical protein [Polyangium jinanense]
MYKTVALHAFALLACVLPACVVDSTTEIEDGIKMPGAAPESAQVDGKIATLELSSGKVIFVDEGDGVGFWEIGNVDLSSLLHEQNASALEVFLALAPEGTPVPSRLVEHHAEVVARTGTVPAEPRKLAPMFVMPAVQNLTNEPFDYHNSGLNCWGWAGTLDDYNASTGYSSFTIGTFQSSFNADSQITGNAIQVLKGATTLLSLPDNGGGVETSWGHEREMAICASKAVPFGQPGSCDGNGVFVSVTVQCTDEAGTFVGVDTIDLEAFGVGARFRSNATNTGGRARKYRIQATFNAENDTSVTAATECQDQAAVVWRSKHTGGSIILP